MIAKCRSHLRHYINAGNSVKTPGEICTWIDGVRGVSPCLISIDNSNKPANVKSNVADINQIFVVQYRDTDMQLFRSFGIGEGRVVDYEQSLIDYSDTYTTEIPFKPSTIAGTASIPSEPEDQDNSWHCPTHNCHQEFKTIARLNHHISHEV